MLGGDELVVAYIKRRAKVTASGDSHNGGKHFRDGAGEPAWGNCCGGGQCFGRASFYARNCSVRVLAGAFNVVGGSGFGLGDGVACALTGTRDALGCAGLGLGNSEGGVGFGIGYLTS